MLSFIVIVSMLMLLLNHPLAFIMSLFAQTLLVCISLKNISLWISLILFLIFLGGILVMFIYVSSLSANEKFNISLTSFLWTFPTAIIFLLILTSTEMMSSTSLGYQRPADYMVINFSISNLALLTYCFVVVYLFLALLLVIDFLNMNKKPLRSMI
uniref:NADH dehydrogenase subunit 6 n=1 Tax=Artemia tibetiana TaxID=351233 RepID=M9NVD5_9CRUS|nr:NADH dehydrogenase subunit 6 [Artemia tibetiana]YP_010735568.1 NADH dehydrogenase subunit 6 [Artemia sorgeloosi]AFP72840.1 NADH dehydrogenase subunit 6 [Artemia tibetiana]AFP72853.1 NADH dehydrogenase subunit 6 [Artemia tibetiana]UZP16830.1 NADH dehydrogenase subunit 6 [Artemia tibetiana]UZP16843.1 NADH dehydrogenase subunit 6 [Artemia tibetiana]UZP16856.1 NADH dehydrogenase subunit 6 [Artemia tibetiana]